MTKPLDLAFKLSSNITQPFLPKALIDVIAEQLLDPALKDMDAFANRIWEVYRTELKFLCLSAGTNPILNSDDMNSWANLLSWMTVELQNWTQQADVGSSKLCTLLILADFQDQDESFWQSAPASIGRNGELLAILECYVRSIKVASPLDTWRMPISAAATEEKINQADMSGDWETLGEILPIDQGFPSPTLRQTVKFLSHFGFDRLASAAKGVNQIGVAFFIVEILGINKALQLAVENVSLHIKFSSVFKACDCRQRAELNTVAQEMLKRILLEVSANEGVWLPWMKVFNKYPERFPHIQTALGSTLAFGHLHAITNYVESVKLNTNPRDERGIVADCLRIFHQEADLETRRHMWRTAYKRWQEWGFDQNSEHSSLSKFSWSALDYAIVGYFVECLTTTELETEIQRIIALIDTVDRGWHASISDCISARNRFWSQLQPLTHARHVLVNHGDWLMKDSEYILNYPPAVESYNQLKYCV